MTSQINPNNIDGTFPIAGQDNNSQGFRDNFTNTKQNFQYAYSEISAIQSNAVLAGQSNNLNDSIVGNAALLGARLVTYSFGAVSGAQTITFGNGSYQYMELGGSVTLTFSGFPTLTNRAQSFILQVFVPNTGYTVTWPAAVSIGLSRIANTSGQIASFTSTGYYEFELTTLNNGTSWLITESTRPSNVIQGNLTFQTVVANASATGISMTVSNIGGVAVGNITATNFIGNIITTGNSASYTGNVTAANIIANTGIYGTIRTASQTNITLVGTLTSLSVSGNANVGNLTVSSLTDLCGGDAVGVQFANAVNSGSTQIYSNVGFVLINPTSSTISSHTITMPATPYRGQSIRIGFSNTVTTLTQAGSGSDSVYGAITTANTSAGTTWIYYQQTNVNSGNGVWYRIG